MAESPGAISKVSELSKTKRSLINCTIREIIKDFLVLEKVDIIYSDSTWGKLCVGQLLSWGSKNGKGRGVDSIASVSVH